MKSLHKIKLLQALVEEYVWKIKTLRRVLVEN